MEKEISIKDHDHSSCRESCKDIPTEWVLECPWVHHWYHLITVSVQNWEKQKSRKSYGRDQNIKYRDIDDYDVQIVKYMYCGTLWPRVIC